MRLVGRGRRPAAVGVAVIVLATGLAGLNGVVGVAGTADAATGPTDVPVAGSFNFSPSRDASQGTAVGVVNAVRRIPGGTVVYYSFGLPKGAQPLSMSPNSLGQVTIGNYSASSLAYVEVVDPVGLMRYRPMVAGTTCLCSSFGDLPSQLPGGALYSGYVIVPPLPETVTTVTVTGFFGAAVTNVPIGSGLLAPAAASAKTISALSAGWPTVATDQVSSVSDPSKFILPLTKRSASLDNSRRTSETSTKVSVELSSDVLFAVDKSALTSAAQSRIADVASDIAKRATGVVTVTGYTDSTGSPSHNQTLSVARAHSVLAALKQAVHASGVSFASAGHGEADPVAGNATSAGRALNRRVTIVYSVAKH
jgi:peptidoglycan-binding protein ArfA